MMTEILKLELPSDRPAFIFINGPQGLGKTKICKDFAESFNSQSKTTVIISLDDFYLTFQDQEALASQGNALLKYRGLPGTHDISLALRTLERLALGNPVLIPRYDKSLNKGRGDRLPESEWERISGPVDRIIFEGWCLGFKHLPSDYSFKDYGGYEVGDIKNVNENFVQLEELYIFADAFVHFRAKDIEYVVDWRWEQELALKRQHGSNAGLSLDEVKDFVSRFMPIYHYYNPGLAKGFCSDKVDMSYQFTVDRDRKIVGQDIFKLNHF